MTTPTRQQADLQQVEQVLKDDVLDDSIPWYAVRLFTVRTALVTDYLDEHGVSYFVPMEYAVVEDSEHHVRHKLRPVVRNLIFIKANVAAGVLRNLLAQAPFRSSVLRKSREEYDYYEIPARQMIEFQAMCNPDIAMRQFLSQAQAKLKVGTPVYVKYGPLKGLSGRLVRSNKKYFLLKEIPGMGVMLKVARWCCTALE